MTGYPPQPWRLVGDLYAAVLPVRSRALAALVPPGHRLVHAAGWCPAVLIWVAYRPEGVLSYRELAVALPVRRGWRVRATVPWIWVDSATSRDGGRELWALPKELASFTAAGPSVQAASEDGRALASCSFSSWLRLPGRLPVRFSLSQPAGAAGRRVPVRGRGGLQLGRASVRIPAAGPLDALAGDRAVPAAALRDFVLVFGEAPVEKAAGKAFNGGS